MSYENILKKLNKEDRKVIEEYVNSLIEENKELRKRINTLNEVLNGILDNIAMLNITVNNFRRVLKPLLGEQT